MRQLTPEEQRQVEDNVPKGTFALLLVFSAALLGAWLFMYFGRFLLHGPVQ